MTPTCFRLLVALTALLIPFLSSCEKNEPPMPLSLPDFDRAVFESFSPTEQTTSEISSSQCMILREAFQSVSMDFRPAKWQIYGHLSLYKGPILLVRFRLFQDSKAIGPFIYEGKYYRGYDEALFRSLDWQRIPESIPKQIKVLKQSEMSLEFSASTSFSESYNFPPK